MLAPFLLLSLLSLQSLILPVSATHFAFGTISWAHPNATLPNRITVTLESAWRRDFVGWNIDGKLYTSNNEPEDGSVISGGPTPPGNFYLYPTDANGTLLKNIDYSDSDRSFYSGALTIPVYNPNAVQDGMKSSPAPPEVILKVQQVLAADDLFLATASVTLDLPFPRGVGGYLIFYQDCCRLEHLMDGNGNLDEDGRMTYLSATYLSSAAAGKSRGITTSSSARQYGQVNTDIGFTIPVTGANTPHFELMPTTGLVNSGLAAATPQEGSFAVNSSTGIVSWTPTQAGLYAVQFRISDVSNRNDYIVLDTIFEIDEPCTENCPPTIDSLPSQWNFAEGVQATYAVTARLTTEPSGEDSPVVQIQINVPPEGASFGPMQQASINDQQTNPTYAFTWTPPIGAVDQIACFQAVDVTANTHSLGNNCVVLHISPQQENRQKAVKRAKRSPSRKARTAGVGF